MNKQEQTQHTKSDILRFSKMRADSQDTPMSVLLKRQNSKPGVRGIFAIILACISVVVLASCGNDYTNELGTGPGAETRWCTPQTGQSGKQPSPTAGNSHSAPPHDAMFGFDAQHTHYNPYEHTLSPTNVSRLVLDWTATTARPRLAPGLTSPTVANGVVYAASNDGKLYAFKADTGAVLWNTCIDSSSSSPAVVKGVVYVGSSNGKLYALNANTGSVLWSATAGYSIDSSPVVANGVVYVGSSYSVTQGMLSAFKADTGAVLWTVTAGIYVNTSPAVANGVVYFVAGLSTLYAVSTTTGAPLWNAVMDTAHSSGSSPTVVNGVVYVGSFGKLHAFNALTGAVLWTAKAVGFIESSPAVANSMVYIGADDGKVSAFNASTGAILWSTALDPHTYFKATSQTVANGVVYADSGNGKLYALNANTGSVLWSISPVSGVDTTIFETPLYTPAVANGVVYVDLGNFKVFAYHLPS